MSIFSTAKALPTTPTPKGKTKDKAEVTMPGLEKFAILKSLAESIKTLCATYEAQVKAEAKERFCDGTKRPENFRGIEGSAEASVECRKRSTNSPLSDDEVTALTQAGLPFDTIETTVETFVINPVYASDSALLDRVSKAIAKVPGLPADFILHQNGVSKHVVTDATIDKMYANGKAKDFLDMVTVIALKPKLKDTDINRMIAVLKTEIEGEKAAARDDLMGKLRDSAKTAKKK